MRSETCSRLRTFSVVTVKDSAFSVVTVKDSVCGGRNCISVACCYDVGDLVSPDFDPQCAIIKPGLHKTAFAMFLANLPHRC
jgi:hypothetical protein